MMTADAVVPVQPEERIASLDVLRAFALLGILVVNMYSFAGPLWNPSCRNVRGRNGTIAPPSGS